MQSVSSNIDRELLEVYASEQYYFSTFALMSEPIERVVPLRSTAKQRYDKKHLCIKESVRLRTKVLELACGLCINNLSGQLIMLSVLQRGLPLDPVRLAPKAEARFPMWLRSDDTLTFLLGADSKVSVGFQEM